MLSNGDFIKIEYTGTDKNGQVFDSTSGDIAKALHGKEGPLLIVMGHDRLVEGMYDALQKLKIGEETNITLPPGKAFGSRHKELLRIFPEKELRSEEMEPHPGLHVEMETENGKTVGIIRSVNSGRVLIDFNHPLADQSIRYHIKLVVVASNSEEKIRFLMEQISLSGDVEVEKGKATVRLAAASDEEKKTLFSALVRTLIPDIQEVKIEEK